MEKGMPRWIRGRVLGRGSTATVSLASSGSGELFAVKSAGLACSEFLQREARIHSAIGRSPYVISYLGYDVHDEPLGAYFNLFVEYAPRGSISDEIKRRGSKMSMSDVRAYARDIMLGLAHLHSVGVAHCDVKGQNVLIGCDGRAKIADFGCARFVNNGEPTRKRRFMGTPMFMAPEVAKGEEQGMAADISAAGCTVIEMATGKPPWPDATDAVSLLHRIAFSGDSPAAPDWMPEEGKDFLSKCSAGDAEQRWSAAELLQHPFLSCQSPDSVSPKSILDQTFLWDTELEAEHETELNSSRPQLIEDLLISPGTGPNWAWDDDWLTVRHNPITAAADAGDRGEHETVVGDAALTPADALSTSISINLEEEGTGVIGPAAADTSCERDVVIGGGGSHCSDSDSTVHNVNWHSITNVFECCLSFIFQLAICDVSFNNSEVPCIVHKRVTGQ